jgi:DNA-binding phage protein
MWMDAYVQEILIRQHIAEAQKIAARHHFLSRAKPLSSRARERGILRQVIQAALIPRIARRIVRMAFP